VRTRSAAWPATRRLEARSSHAVVGVVGREGAGVALCDRERRATPTADCGPAAALSCAPLAARASTKSLGHHGDGVSSPAGPPEAGPPPAYCAAAADPPHCHIQGITRSRSAPGRNPLTVTRHAPIHGKLTKEQMSFSAKEDFPRGSPYEILSIKN
jgi:hypothetical protein